MMLGELRKLHASDLGNPCTMQTAPSRFLVRNLTEGELDDLADFDGLVVPISLSFTYSMPKDEMLTQHPLDEFAIAR
jgi:hypothetical protein